MKLQLMKIKSTIMMQPDIILEKTGDIYSIYEKHSDFEKSTQEVIDVPVLQDEDKHDKSKHLARVRHQGFMAPSYYGGEAITEELYCKVKPKVEGGKSGIEAIDREEEVRELFGDKQLDEKIHKMTPNRWRWLYHWFGFEQSAEILRPANARLVFAPASLTATLTEDEEKMAHDIRKKLAARLRDELWSLPIFHPFVDATQAVNLLCDKVDDDKVDDDKVDESEKDFTMCVIRLSSTIPGAITQTWAKSNTENKHCRFYMNDDKHYWVHVDKVPSALTLEQVKACNPYNTKGTVHAKYVQLTGGKEEK